MQTTDWKKIPAVHMSDTGLPSGHVKNLYNSILKVGQMKNGQKTWMDTSQREMYKKHVKKDPSWVVREIQIKTVWSEDCVLTEITKNKPSENTKCSWEGAAASARRQGACTITPAPWEMMWKFLIWLHRNPSWGPIPCWPAHPRERQSSLIQNSPKLETTPRAISIGVEKWVAVYSHNGILLSRKCSHVDQPGKHMLRKGDRCQTVWVHGPEHPEQPESAYAEMKALVKGVGGTAWRKA